MKAVTFASRRSLKAATRRDTVSFGEDANDFGDDPDPEGLPSGRPHGG